MSDQAPSPFPPPPTRTGDDVTILGAGASPVPPSNAGGKKEISHGLGVFGDAPDFSEAQSKAQDAENEGIIHSMRPNPTITICGVKCSDVSMESLALLQEIQSPFVQFDPKLSQNERRELKELAERRVGKRFADNDEGDEGAGEGQEAPTEEEELEPLDDEENKRLDELIEKAKEENKQFKNPMLSILVFFSLHDPNLDSDTLDEMVFERPKDLRKHALKLGRTLPPLDLEQAGLEIGLAIKRAKDGKVVPVNKDGPSPGNG